MGVVGTGDMHDDAGDLGSDAGDRRDVVQLIAYPDRFGGSLAGLRETASAGKRGRQQNEEECTFHKL